MQSWMRMENGIKWFVLMKRWKGYLQQLCQMPGKKKEGSQTRECGACSPGHADDKENKVSRMAVSFIGKASKEKGIKWFVLVKKWKGYLQQLHQMPEKKEKGSQTRECGVCSSGCADDEENKVSRTAVSFIGKASEEEGKGKPRIILEHR